MTKSIGDIRYRPMVASDVGPVPEDCHGSREALLGRIEDLGGAAMLAFDGEQHVAQLQFRRYDPMCRSAKGIWQPDYWGDFGEHAPELPEASVNIFCYHVGQLSAGEERCPDYQGRGIGLALLDHFLDWAASREFAGVVAKFTPDDRAVMGFMGGQPATAYTARGFEVVSSWVDQQLSTAVVERKIVPADSDPEVVARVGVCVKPLES